MFSLLLFSLALACPILANGTRTSGEPTLLLVVGAVGESEFGTNFLRQARGWMAAAEKGQTRVLTVGLDDGMAGSDLDLFRATLAAEPTEGDVPLWLVLIGHGTFDGREARFNLRGPDFTAADLGSWLEGFRRPLIVINAASSSAPFLAELAGPNRVVITATRSGNEQNFTRFGAHLAETIADEGSDFDQDGQTSLLEGFLSAAARTAEFYKTEGRLATEHPLIDDNGDGLGTPADWFRGVRPVRKAQDDAGLDGRRAHQIHLVASPEEQRLPAELRVRRDALEQEVFQLREEKASWEEQAYYRRLEELLLELARLQAAPSGK